MNVFSAIFVMAFHLAGALRKRKAQKRQQQPSASCPNPQPGNGVVGEQGKVDFLATYGAPGAGSPGLQHQTNTDGSLPGMRTWTRDGTWVDIVPVVTSAIWLWHPVMSGRSIAAREDEGKPVTYNASAETSRLPGYPSLSSIPLHKRLVYVNAEAVNAEARRGCDRWNSFAIIANWIGYEQDPIKATELADRYGWNLAGTAYHPGLTGWIGGPQVSHLLQNQETLECVLTFQGTQVRRDWYANIAFRPTHFCGMTEPDETCWLFGFDTCKVRKPRGSFAHYGFAENLRKMVQEPQWQETIRANLGKCSAVYTAGHSLGGAVASLFTACTSSNMTKDDFGYEEDFGHMWWTKGEPGLITKFIHLKQ